jgi:hypothetical protein
MSLFCVREVAGTDLARVAQPQCNSQFTAIHPGGRNSNAPICEMRAVPNPKGYVL